MPSTDDLARLYDAHGQALFAFLLNLTREDPETRDVLQEVFCKLAAKPGLLNGVRDPRGFLLRLARNLAVDRMRRRSSRERGIARMAAGEADLFASAPDPDEQAFRDRLARAMGVLPPEQREVVHLKLWEGLTFDAIAGVLDISPNTAASRYRYGLDKLRTELRPLYEEIR